MAWAGGFLVEMPWKARSFVLALLEVFPFGIRLFANHFFSERNEGVLEVFLENAALLVCSCNHFGIFVALQW